jgi:hypothetical protein
MKLAFALAGLVTVAGCGTSALPPSTSDLLGASPVDAARSPDDGGASDLAASPPDAAFAVGVPCGGPICDTTTGLVCCEVGTVACMPPPCGAGIQTDGCDGPEDCSGGARCCLFVDPFFGTACSTSCSQNGGMRGVICHVDDDCGPNEQCVPLEASGGIRGCISR